MRMIVGRRWKPYQGGCLVLIRYTPTCISLFPRWRFWDREATPIETVYRLADVARKQLKYVYEGNC